MKNSAKFNVFDIVLIAVLTAILTTQEFNLTFLPNIQLTVFLLVLYSKTLKTGKTLIIIFIHVLIDNLLMGSFNLLYVPFMMIGWSLIPLLLNTVFRKVEKPIFLALLGVLFAFIYSWIFIIPSCIMMNMTFWPYFLADIPFEVLLAGSSFLTILWLYKPLYKVINNLLVKSNNTLKEQ